MASSPREPAGVCLLPYLHMFDLSLHAISVPQSPTRMLRTSPRLHTTPSRCIKNEGVGGFFFDIFLWTIRVTNYA
jgi:hypothetical protein